MTGQRASAPPPRVLRAEPGSSGYELDESLLAVHGDMAARVDAAVASLEGGDIAIVPAGRSIAGATLGPVYRAGPGGPIAVPTGRLFVRFGEGTRAERRSEELAAAGFRLESVPAYAPHAAWVRPASGAVTDALANLDRLRSLEGVERIEPQIVSEAAPRQ